LNTLAISVIIPTYNCAQQLALVLTSLCQQSLSKESFEVIVVDDGSSDNTKQVVEEFASQLTIRYFWQEDLGFRAASARNLGAINACGQLLLFLDSSVLLAHQTLQAHCLSHQKQARKVLIGYVFGYMSSYLHSDWGFAPCDVVDIAPYIAHDVDLAIAKLRHGWALDVREAKYLRYGDDIAQWPIPFDVFWTCHVSLPKSLFFEVGAFDESFIEWGGEDIDLGLRLFQAPHVRWEMQRACPSLHLPHQPASANDEARRRRIMESMQQLALRHPCPQSLAYVDCYREQAEPLDVNGYLLRKQWQQRAA
jgi:glycosyltransferase involved in cell wall biosynthesis